MRKIDKLESDVTSKQTTLEQVMNALYVSAALNPITDQYNIIGDESLLNFGAKFQL